MFENLRLAWRRAKVRAQAESQGATTKQAKQAADILYPLPGQERPTIIDLDDPAA